MQYLTAIGLLVAAWQALTHSLTLTSLIQLVQVMDDADFLVLSITLSS